MNRATQFLGQQRAPHRVAPAAERGPMRKARIPLKFRCECGDKGTVHRHTAAYPDTQQAPPPSVNYSLV